MENHRVILFMHIPKTAGRTLDHVIRRQYHPDEYLGHLENFYLASQTVKAIPKAELERLKVITGHFAYGLHNDLQCKCTYITMLRDPIHRIIDSYYVLRVPGHHLNEKYANVSLEEYVNSNEASVNNLQTRYLLGAGEYFPLEINAQTIAKGKQIIDQNFAFIGTVEHVEESIFLLKSLFGWRNIFTPQININPHLPTLDTIPQDILKTIAERNSADRELYQYAQSKLQATLADLSPEMREDLEVFLAANKQFKLKIHSK